MSNPATDLNSCPDCGSIHPLEPCRIVRCQKCGDFQLEFVDADHVRVRCCKVNKIVRIPRKDSNAVTVGVLS